MNGNAPCLGVVIPTWNAKEDLSFTLDHFARLPDRIKSNIEIVISDGASTDGTLEVAASFMDLIGHVDSRPDNGVYDAMNRGANLLCAPWVWFMGAGDIPGEEALDILLQVLLGSSREEMHAFNVRGREPLEPGVPRVFTPQWGSVMHWRNTMHHQGLIAPTAWVLEHPLPTMYRVLGDYAWCLDRLRDGAHLTCHDAPALAAVQSGGLSRSFTPSLYLEEWKVKWRRIPKGAMAAHLIWLPMKWAFKLMSSARAMFGSSTPQ